MSCRRKTRSARAWAIAVAAVVAVIAAPAAAAGATPDMGDAGQAIAAVLVFLVLLGILGKWAWGPIVQQLKRREETIATAVEQANRSERKAEALLKQYAARLEAVEAEAGEIIATGRQAAAAEREEFIAAARQEARKAAGDAQKEIERARRAAVRELQHSTAQLATDIAGQILRQALTPEEQGRLLEESLEEIRKQAEKET